MLLVLKGPVGMAGDGLSQVPRIDVLGCIRTSEFILLAVGRVSALIGTFGGTLWKLM